MARTFSASIDTVDGRMDDFVTYPREDGTHPAVLSYMDAFGIRDVLRDDPGYQDLANRVPLSG